MLALSDLENYPHPQGFRYLAAAWVKIRVLDNINQLLMDYNYLDVRNLMPFNIIHLSDIHFGAKSHYGSYSQYANLMIEVGDALAKRGMKPGPGKPAYFDAAVLSGDFTWQAGHEGFDEATRFIKLLSQSKYCAAENIFTVPGNHDMAFNRQGVQHWLGPEVERSYRGFLDGFMGIKNAPLAFIKPFKQQAIVLAGLNSSRIVRQDTDELGFVGYDQLFAVMRRVWARRPPPRDRAELLILFIHHHLTQIDTHNPAEPLGDRWRRKPSYMIDAPTVLEFMRQANVQMVLHGHQHLSWIDPNQAGRPFSNRGALPNPVLICGAGSAGIRYPESREEHHFQVFEIADDLLQVVVHHFRADAQAPRGRPWHYEQLQPIPLRRCSLGSPDANTLKGMEARSAAWVDFYGRLQENWAKREIWKGGQYQLGELLRRLMEVYQDALTRGQLPARYANRAAFSALLKAGIAELSQHLPSAQAEYERLFKTSDSLGIDQFMLRWILDWADRTGYGQS